MKGDYKKHGMCHVDVSVNGHGHRFTVIQQWFKTEKRLENVASLISIPFPSPWCIQI